MPIKVAPALPVTSAQRLQLGDIARSSMSAHRKVVQDNWNLNPQPFVWHATANEIITKVRRGRATLNHQIKFATDH